ncbi:carbohydrate porin [Caulobacter sp. S45]|uniref:carbohydrate porin n=1 Tax=Caulobacter sp. S45 TaxID=1641861 RepID=UPI00131EA9AD|nr:carbohydrate porin [Caulobacter sp. S45]
MRRTWLYAGILVTLFASNAANAQEAPGRTATPGLLSDFGQTLDDDGIRVRAQLINEMAANPIGGIKQGNTDAGQAQIGLSFDLHKLVGIPGGQFHVSWIRSYGDSDAKNFSGDFIKSQEVYKNAFHPFRMSIFAYEQKLFDDKLDVLVGRLGSSAFYGRLSNTCYSESGITCGVPQLMNSESNITFPTSATWGGNVRYHFTKDIAFQTGAFEVNSFIQHTNGYDFSTDKATGVSTFEEVSFGNYDLTNYRYPGDIKFGGWVSTAPFSDPYFNTKGQSLGLFGGTAAANTSLRNGIYIMGEKAVWRPDPALEKSVTVIAGYNQSLETEEIASMQVFTGAVARGVIPGREHDIVSLTGTYIDLTSREIEFLRDSRIKAGGHGVNNPNEFALEADYSALLFNSARVAPNISYIINPDNSNIPKTKILPQNIVTFGIKITFNLATFLGLPLAPNLSD